jgi:hypothetical protein
MTCGISPANPTASIWNTAGGSTNAFDAALDAFVALLKPWFHTSDELQGAEVFTQADCASAPIFRFAYDLGGPIAGTSSTADAEWSQASLTFKAGAGGRFRLQLMEQIVAVDEKVALPTGSAFIANLTNYILSVDNVLFARNNTFPVFPLNLVTKTNDKLRKKYLSP